MKLIRLILLSLALLISYTEIRAATSSATTLEENTVTRKVNPVQYSKGMRLFQLNCALCHGKHGEGAKNWRSPDENGKYPAPPLNGTGHAWHHSSRSLANTIRNGTGKIGGNMPAWKDKLSNGEISLILIWVTAQWPDEIYTAWYNRFYQQK